MKHYPEPLREQRPDFSTYKALPMTILRKANQERAPFFVAHKPDIAMWRTCDWYAAVFGEAGEFMNEVKKYQRGDYTNTEFKVKAGKELCDIISYLDILVSTVQPAAEREFTNRKDDPLAAYLRKIEATDANFAELVYCTTKANEKMLSKFEQQHPEDTRPIAPHLTEFTSDALTSSLHALWGAVKSYKDFLGGALDDGVVDEALFKEIGRTFEECEGIECAAVVARAVILLSACVAISARLGIDLGGAIVNKFNGVSERINAPVFIRESEDGTWNTAKA